MKAAFIFTGEGDSLKAAGRMNAFTEPLTAAGVEGEAWYLGDEDASSERLAEALKGIHTLVACSAGRTRLPEEYLDMLAALYQDRRPELLIFDGEVSPLAVRFAKRIGGGCLTNCRAAGTHKDEDGLWIKRPVYNSHADAVYRRQAYPQVLTVSKTGPVAELLTGGAPVEIHRIDLETKRYDYCLERRIVAPRDKNPLEDAKLVLVGGRGLGSKENYERLKRLAQVWGGACGCTRAAAINGWADTADIIGQSGHVLRAELCVAIGVSGAAPFMAGVENVKTLVAVNTDQDAPVFARADYGIVGDAVEVLASWEEKLKEASDEN